MGVRGKNQDQLLFSWSWSLQELVIFNDGETCYKGGGGQRAAQEHGNVNPPPTWGYLEIFLLGLEGVHLFALFYLLTPVLTNQLTNL